MRNWLEHKTIILSGASSGIGRSLTKLFIEKYNARVVGIGRKEEKMRSLQEELGEKGKNFRYRLFDVSQKENWTAFALWLTEQNITPNLLINNAGVFPTFQRALKNGVETTEQIMQNNYFSIVYAVDALTPLLMGEGKNKPSIINIASSAALCTVVGTSAYSASKSAVKGYTEALQMEEREKYVAVIYPGTTATELFRADERTKSSALDQIAMPAEKMAKKIARVIVKKKKRAVLGWDAKLMNVTAKIAPTRGPFLIRSVMKLSKSKIFSELFESEYLRK